MSATENKAVFLSYASQDAEAARKICEALRAAGVEVWFDQSELVGGDAWDQKIRKQIRECALLIPIISKTTQGRREAYFRLEWKLADERTHLMARGTPFLLPVTIDETSDRDALVPDSFVAVQWTKAPAGETPPAFGARVKKLLDGGSEMKLGRPRPGLETRGGIATPPVQSGGETRKRWLAPVIGGVVVALLALVISRPWEKSHSPADAEKPAEAAKPAIPLTEAQKLVAQARALIDDDPLAVRENYRMAGELCERATRLSPDDGEAWATYARVTWHAIRDYADRSDKTIVAMRSQAERAIHLAPTSIEAGLAMADFEYISGSSPAAEQRLRALLERAPTDQRLLTRLAEVASAQDKLEECIQWVERADALSGGAPAALNVLANSYWVRNRYQDMDRINERSLARRATADAYQQRLLVLVWGWCDIAAARSWLAKIPAAVLLEDRVIVMAFTTLIWSRQPAEAVALLERTPREFLEEGRIYRPRDALAGEALLLAGKPRAAEVKFQSAFKAVEERLAANPNDSRLFDWKGRILARLGNQPEAVRQLETGRELDAGRESLAADDLMLLGRYDEALAEADKRMQHDRPRWPNLYGILKFSPVFDPVRADPRFQKILARGQAWMDEMRQSPTLAPKPSAVVDEKSVAVLAFANLSDDKGNEYFSDGISEELLNVLAKVPGLKVTARTSSFHFKGKDTPIPEIAQQLGVAYVIEGSVRKAGDKVRITAQLIKAADGFHVWSDTFTRDLKDIFAVQDEIAGLIAKNLELKMGFTAARPTIDLEAYQEYLAGRALFAKAGNGDLQEAVRHFEKAVAIEPKFTAAWVQLASVNTQLGRWGGAPTLQAWAAARAAIDRARALEPDSPEVLLALGWILRTSDWDWRGAEQAFRHSLQFRPNHPDTLAGLAVLLFNIGQKEEAFRLGQQAALLDPLNPATQIDLSLMFYLNNNLAEAERSARRALQLAPGGAGYHCILAWSLIKQGRLGEAETEVGLDSDAIEKPLSYGLLALARGQGAVAREKLAKLEEISRTNGDLADVQNSIAWLAVGLEEKDRPFAALEKARHSRDPSNSWLRSSPYLDPLHSDPRWNVLLHQVGLADDQLK